jgi:hypothetical protein
MNRIALLCVSLGWVACTDEVADGVPEDDAVVDDGGGVELGKADGFDPSGVYAMAAGVAPWNGDIPNLELHADTYVRNRCYGWDCEQMVPETDRFDLVRSSSGRSYLRFWSFEVQWSDAAGDRDEVPVIADVYEVKMTAGGLQLRKTWTNHWQTLARASLSALCRDSGGLPGSGGSCECRQRQFFCVGAGGCIDPVVGTEDACDTTDGMYTDDDATPIGTFCRCGYGRVMTEAGCADL